MDATYIFMLMSMYLNGVLLYKWYKTDGSIDVVREDGEDLVKFSLNLNYHPYELERRNRIIFKINRTEQEPTDSQATHGL